MMIYFGWAHIYIGLVALAISLIVLWQRNKSILYIFFFSIFWIYLMGVISVIVFPFPIEISDPTFTPSINLIPFYVGNCEIISLCIRSVYENILLTIPFGFGICFILRLKPKNIIWLALAVGFVFELTQLIISLVFKSAFRSVDINDVILNAMGILLGYGLFRIFSWLYLSFAQKLNMQPKYIFAYIYDIVSNPG